MAGPTPPNVSVHGKRLVISPNNLLLDGRPIGSDEVGVTNTWYVSSAIAGLDGRSPATAMATLAAAAAKASAGDKIVVLEGHTETISAATTLTTVAGLKIVGLGNPRSSRRPTITFDTANTAALAITKDDISFTNMIFVANFLSIAAAFTLSTAKNFTLNNCEFRETSSVLNFLNIVKSTGAANTADGLTVAGCMWFGLGTTSVNSFALIADANDRVTMTDNFVLLERTADTSILLTVTTGASTKLNLDRNVVISKQTATTAGSLAALNASSTGVIARNFAGTLTTASDKLFTTTVGVFAFENRVSGVVGATGFVIPAADS